MHGHGVKTDPQGNIFEGEWKEGKPQIKGDKGKQWADLLPWLSESARFRAIPAAPAPPRRAQLPQEVSARGPYVQVGSVPAPQRRGGGYESVLTHDPDDDRH